MNVERLVRCALGFALLLGATESAHAVDWPAFRAITQLMPTPAKRSPELAIQQAAAGQLSQVKVYQLPDATPASVVVGSVVTKAGAIIVLMVQPSRLIKISGNSVSSIKLPDLGIRDNEGASLKGPALLPDGKIVLWHGPSQRIFVLSPDGGLLTSRNFAGADKTGSKAMYWDTMGHIFLPVKTDSAHIGSFFRYSVVDSGRATRVDLPPTSAIPQYAPVSVAGLEVWQSIPFFPLPASTVSYTGTILWSTGEHLEVLGRIDGRDTVILRRPDRLVPVSEDERANQKEIITFRNRVTDPTWQYAGRPIPMAHPQIESLSSDADGRTWLVVPMPSASIPVGERKPIRDVPGAPVVRWRRMREFELFSTKGEFLGHYPMPDGAQYGQLIAQGSNVWIPQRNSTTFVPQLVQYKIDRTSARTR